MNFYLISSFLLFVLADASLPTAQVHPYGGTIVHVPRLNNFPNAVAHCNPTSRGLFYPGSCILILLQIRRLPDWDIAQEFREGIRPQINPNDPQSKPPFAFVSQDGRCVLVVRARRIFPERFSWEQVSWLADLIIQQCPTHGGFSYIGGRERWTISLSDADLTADRQWSSNNSIGSL